ncbi:MAG: hypothetical protein ABI665_18050 [Vicinamibacterales bacterium]
MKRLAIAAVAVLAVYLLRLDRAAGLIVDDAWYALLAKALAQGDGFRLISSAVTPIMPAVPPGYPLMLAPLFLIRPAFPQNVFLLKAVSIAAMMGVGLVVYRYLVKYRETAAPMAAAIAAATVLTPAFVFLATSTLMAECVFTLGLVLTVMWLDRTARAQPTSQARCAAAAGMLAAATMLVRTAGAATFLGGLLFLLQQRAYRSAAAFTLVASLCLGPWMIYSTRHAPTLSQSAEHGGTIAYSYADLLSMVSPRIPRLGRIHAADLVPRIRTNLIGILGRDVGGVLVPSLFRGADESGEEVVALAGSTATIVSSMGGSPVTVTITLMLSAIVLVGFIRALRRGVTAAEMVVGVSLAVLLTVPTATFRYVLPLTPFLLFYFVTGLEAMTRAPLAARIAVMCVLGLQLQDHAGYIALKLRDPARLDWLRDARGAAELTDWMNANLEGEGAVASTNPGLVYLLTGRKTVATDEFSRGWERWKASGVRYIVALRPLALPSKSLTYRLLYQSPHRIFW